MILIESVFCGVVNSDGLVWSDGSEAMESAVHESVDWREHHSAMVEVDVDQLVEVEHCGVVVESAWVVDHSEQ